MNVSFFIDLYLNVSSETQTTWFDTIFNFFVKMMFIGNNKLSYFSAFEIDILKNLKVSKKEVINHMFCTF